MLKIVGFFLFLGIFYLSISLSSRHMIYREARVLFDIGIRTRFEKEPLCQTKASGDQCAMKIIADSGGFKFSKDFRSALSLASPAHDPTFFARYTFAALSSFKPANLWIAKKEGTVANQLLSQELDELTVALEKNRSSVVEHLGQSTDVIYKNEYEKLLILLDSKIREIQDLHRLL